MVWERILGVARQSDLRQAHAVAAAAAGALERDRGRAGALPVHRLGGVSARHVCERRRVHDCSSCLQIIIIVAIGGAQVATAVGG